MDAPRFRVHHGAMTTRTGFSLIEVALVLLIAALLAAVSIPSLSRGRDALAVRAARVELASAFAVARFTAIRAGGAALVIDTAAGDVWIETAAGVRLQPGYPLAARYGVSLRTDRPAPVMLRYDALGIGRIANATIRVERRRASATLTISSYGRVRT